MTERTDTRCQAILRGVVERLESFQALWRQYRPCRTARYFWRRRLSPFKRRWAAAFVIGITYGFVAHLLLHTWPLVDVENWAFDSVMRMTASIDRDTPPDARGLALIDIDDATWQSRLWGGGEPQRAPRKELVQLIDAAFAAGAQQVVLDVLVEERDGQDATAAQVAERAEDDQFAGALTAMMGKAHFGDDRYLILTRSLRRPEAFEPPRPGTAVRAGKAPDREVRRSRSVDAAIAGTTTSSGGAASARGRIDLGLPYFYRDADGVLRGWHFFELGCERQAQGHPDRLVALPSVQLLVYAKNAGLGSDRRSTLRRVELPAGSVSPCETGDAAMPASEARAVYWNGVRREFCGSRPSKRCPLPEVAREGAEIGNRIIFRHRPGAPDFEVRVMRALDLLDGSGTARAADYFRDRIVVIAQSFAESGDRHDTPLGSMTGGWVLLNAIDSITRGHFVEPPSTLWTLAFLVLECAIVGLFFALVPSLCRVVLVGSIFGVVLLTLCYHVFQFGLWLDFAIPVLGVAVHQRIHTLSHRRHSGAGKG